MDAARELAQLLDRELRLLARLRDELRGAVGIAGDPRLGEPERDGHRDEPLLRAVVEVALDPPPLGVGGGDDALARVAQRVHAVAQQARAAQLGRLAWEADLTASDLAGVPAPPGDPRRLSARRRAPARRDPARGAPCVVSRPCTSTANA